VSFGAGVPSAGLAGLPVTEAVAALNPSWFNSCAQPGPTAPNNATAATDARSKEQEIMSTS
jgi:hypothetical protein